MATENTKFILSAEDRTQGAFTPEQINTLRTAGALTVGQALAAVEHWCNK